MKILAIETSCDDTGVAILERKSGKFKVLSNIVSSQTIHQNYGGVFPMMAKREHQVNLVPVLIRVLKQAKLANPKPETRNPKPETNSKFKIINSILEREPELLKQLLPFLEKYEKPDIDAIAVTNGPGLEPCLWIGVNFARALSFYWNIPIIPVNHIEGHILVSFLNPKLYTLNPKRAFPAMCLVVSGGHTQLVLMKKIGDYKIIGETRDDAAGECFDKCAKILGLGYPGGPIIAKIADDFKLKEKLTKVSKLGDSKLEIQNLSLPRPMLNSKDYDFSFSGLKTAVLYAVRDKKQDTITKKYVSKMCVEVQQSIIDVLLKKTLQAAKDYKVKTIILGGGVSANKELRKQFTLKTSPISKSFQKEKIAVKENTKDKKEEVAVCYKTDGRQNRSINVVFPDPKFSTDNGLMIAVAAYFNRKPFGKLKARKKASWKNLEANANLRVGE